MNTWAFIAGVVAGAVGGIAAALGWRSRAARARGGDVLTVDYQHALDLLRRAHGGIAACLVIEDDTPALSLAESRPDQATIDRTVATARLARGDGRVHPVAGDPAILAVGDGETGAALAFRGGLTGAPAEQAVEDLRRLIAGSRVLMAGGQLVHGAARRAFDIALARLDSVESLATALCENARSATDRPTAVVLRDPATHVATVVAVSRSSDRRLVGARVTAESSAGRATMGPMPHAGSTLQELLGVPLGDRRQRHEAGIAFPLHTGREGIGALVVFGNATGLAADLQEQVAGLARELTPHLARAAAVRAAEARALTDELTGLPNRRALDRVLAQKAEGLVSVLMVDVDHFKRLNDGFGHAAGDAALKHIAQLFHRTLREGDVAARYGGEEFALVLNGASANKALEVAERVRRATAESKLIWAGAELKVTISVGVASYPEPIRDTANLQAAADAALLRAKENGRNRTEFAKAG
ncbi:MAG: GGDEF domain-containing protein [Gemmatimonadetes bacterium]|nr:GGDEF domain-containing protein [Gemmatimonadota bacterium]